MRGPLDDVAVAALKRVTERAQRNGLDVHEELNKVGLIATAPRIQEAVYEALKNFRDRLHEVDIAPLLSEYYRGNSNPPTPTDVQRLLLTWIDRYIEIHYR
jgi:hypothetical protein